MKSALHYSVSYPAGMGFGYDTFDTLEEAAAFMNERSLPPFSVKEVRPVSEQELGAAGYVENTSNVKIIVNQPGKTPREAALVFLGSILSEEDPK